MDNLFKQNFIDQNISNKKYFISGKKSDKFLFDLPSYAYDIIKSQGINNIEIIADDTYSLENKYFSFRRSTHQNETKYGRQISVISLK